MISLVYTSLVYWIVHYGEKKLLNFGQKPFFDCASPMGYNLILYLYCCFGAKVMIFLCSNSENWSMQYRSLGNNNILCFEQYTKRQTLTSWSRRFYLYWFWFAFCLWFAIWKCMVSEITGFFHCFFFFFFHWKIGLKAISMWLFL